VQQVLAGFLEIEAHAEVRTLRRDHESAYRIVGPERSGRTKQVAPQHTPHGVTRLLTVQPESGHVLVDLKRDDVRREFHGSSFALRGPA